MNQPQDAAPAPARADETPQPAPSQPPDCPERPSPDSPDSARPHETDEAADQVPSPEPSEPEPSPTFIRDSLTPTLDPEYRGETPSAAPSGTALVVARALSLATRRGTVFGPLDFTIDRRTLALASGPAGSGRSSLLLAVAGRMRGVQGRVAVGGLDAIGQARLVRREVAVARIAGVVVLDERMRVEEAIVERCLTEAIKTRDGSRNFAATANLIGLRIPQRALIAELDSLDAALLTLALATVRPASLIVYDDLDEHLTRAEEEVLLDAFQLTTRTGPAILAATTDVDLAPNGATLIHL